MESETLIQESQSQQPQQDTVETPVTDVTTEPSYSKERYSKGTKTDWINLVDHQTYMSASTTMENARTVTTEPSSTNQTILSDFVLNRKLVKP